TAMLIAASFVLAALSWRYIERPFRSREFRPSRLMLFGSAATAMAVTALCGAAIVSGAGLPQRFPPDVQRILAAESDDDPRAVICFGMTGPEVRAGKLCRIGSTAAK